MASPSSPANFEDLASRAKPAEEEKTRPGVFFDDFARRAREADKYQGVTDPQIWKDAARTAVQGATFGFGDEIIGKARAAIERRPYEEVRGEEREAVKRFAREHGPAAAMTELGTGLVTPMGPVGKFVAGAKSTLGAVARSIPVGYAFGGLSALGATEKETVPEMLSAAHEGGTIGAVLSPTLPIVGRAVNSGLTRLDRTAKALTDTEKAAHLYVADKLAARGEKPQALLADLERGQAATRFTGGAAELPETIADLTPTMQRTLRGIKVGGDADHVIEPFLAKRQGGVIDFTKGAEAGGQFDRLGEDLRLSMKLTQKELADKLSSITGKRSKEADALFGAARSNSEAFDLSNTLNKYGLIAKDMADPAQRAIIERAASFFNQAGRAHRPGGAFPVDNVKRFHEAKMALDDLISRAEIREQPNLKRYLTGMKHDLMADVFAPNAKGEPTLNASYRKALDSFASRSELLNAAELGRDFARGKEMVTERMFRELSEGEKAMFRSSWQHETMHGLGGKAAGPTADFTQEFRKPNTAKELRMILPPSAGKTPEFPKGNREKLNELIRRETRISDTARKVLGGSPTAEKTVDAIDIGRIARVARYVGDSKGAIQAAASSLSEALERMGAIKGERARYLAGKLLSTDPAEQKAFLEQIEKTYGTNAVRRLAAAVNRWSANIEASLAGHTVRRAEENKERK